MATLTVRILIVILTTDEITLQSRAVPGDAIFFRVYFVELKEKNYSIHTLLTCVTDVAFDKNVMLFLIQVAISCYTFDLLLTVGTRSTKYSVHVYYKSS